MQNSASLDRLDHVAVAVDNVADAVHRYRKRFRCEVVSDDADKYGDLTAHWDGTRSVYVLDPVGNAVEILKPYPWCGGSHA